MDNLTEIFKIISENLPAYAPELKPKKTSSGYKLTCLDEIAGALIKDDTVEFRRFGVFKTKKQKPRIIIHPTTGKKIKRPAKKIILFETSSNLDKKLNLKIKL